MATIKLGGDEMRYIALFESMTGARALDCLIEKEGAKLTFVVRREDMGLSIGRGGSRIMQMKRVFGKSIEIVQHSDDPAEFLKNLLAPAKVKRIDFAEEGGKRVARVEVEQQDRGLAIGKGGERIRRAKALVLRHHGIHDILMV